MAQLRSMVFLTAFSFLVSACGGSESPTEPGGTDDGGDDGGGGSARTIKDSPSFSADIMEVFSRNGCTASGCHGSGQGGLTMGSAATTHANLVNVTSPTSGEIRVIPGNASDSYLVKKLLGTAAFGAQMPLGGAALDNIDMTNIQNWINQGAENN